MKFKHITRFAAGLAAIASMAVIVGCSPDSSTTEVDGVDYGKMSPQQLAEYLIMESNSFNLGQATQEGGTAKDRMTQDEMQKICSETRNKPSPQQAGQISAEARASIKYPEGGIQLGDWKKGGDLAWGGFGFRIIHNPDDHSKREPSGNCYNCHAMSPDRTGGNLGTSLTGYGKTRGDNEGTRRFVYDMIYNPHAYFPCTNMPRMGANGLLSEQAIADLMAYLLHPDSPVNK